MTRVIGGDAEDSLLGCRGPIWRSEGQPIVRASVKRVNLGHYHHVSSSHTPPTCILTLSTQLPSSHRSKLSTPTNQSGEGTILDTNDTCHGNIKADLALLLSNQWSNALDQGRPTAVLALDIASAFDRVWHAGLVERLRAAGLLVVSRSEHDIRHTLNGAQLTPQPELQILGVTFDSKLTYQAHIRQPARTAAGKLACLRRMAGLLDSKGRELLYKAEIRSSLEYSCLAVLD
ncbi:hypothetical protein E2C01_024672 [Portunus trituberculatus]|uniref:Reverse transcriptase domain-containing protein n=1 Tax=Portunus trituberculatus TaxID=210409 RepID=A0A5B7EFG0_PORTR|nr:hypothetical protein [Portunus trituberculatus]